MTTSSGLGGDGEKSSFYEVGIGFSEEGMGVGIRASEISSLSN